MIDEFILPAFEHIIRQKGWEGIATLFFEKPKIASHGELATAVAMSLAKPLRRAPRSIAEEIVAELKFPENIVEVSIIDLSGRKLFKTKVSDRKVDLSHLTSGTYFIQTKNSKNEMNQQKLIKK